MLSNCALHFYDAQSIGTPALGQPVLFESLLVQEQHHHRESIKIALRQDVAFVPQHLEHSDIFDMDLASGFSEYQWSRKAETIFSRPNTLHIGIGNTSKVDNFIRFGLYRCLSALPCIDLPDAGRFLDLLTLLRVTALLRPQTLPFHVDCSFSEDRLRDFLFLIHPSSMRDDSVKQVADMLALANPKLFSYALSLTGQGSLAERCGLVEGQVETLSELKPVFVCHESLTDTKRYGCFFPMGTDPQYPHIVYMIDLQADLSDLLDDAGVSLTRFIRNRADQLDRPILRVNLNRMPFISHVNVVDTEVAQRLKIDMTLVLHNANQLRYQQDLCLALLEESAASETSLNADADFQLYGAQYQAPDRSLLEKLHQTPFSDWEALLFKANDPRILSLGKRLISRFSSPLLSEEELSKWQAHCSARLIGKSDPAKADSISGYCRSVIAKKELPPGMRTAAQHWLNTVETRDERSRNF